MTKMFRATVLTAVLGSAVAVAGCASQPEDIAATSVSSLRYQDLDCDQVAWELERVDTRVSQLHASLKKKADLDAVQTGVGIVLFWPALFALEGGDGAEAGEYARLKGEKQALEDVVTRKRCAYALKPLPETQESEEAEKADPNATTS